MSFLFIYFFGKRNFNLNCCVVENFDQLVRVRFLRDIFLAYPIIFLNGQMVLGVWMVLLKSVTLMFVQMICFIEWLNFRVLSLFAFRFCLPLFFSPE
uniref:Uncharacterized protein n=1 Tax=Rhizophora mucronata TaxID=61149 RepID=A0A2P2IGZ9_RHIMU